MNLLKRIWRDPWEFLGDDRVQIIAGCLFVFSSGPREIAEGNLLPGWLFVLVGGFMVATAWWRMEADQ